MPSSSADPTEPTILADLRKVWRDVAAAMLCVVVALSVRSQAADHRLTTDEIWHLTISTGLGNQRRWPPDELQMNRPSLTSLDTAAPPLSVWAPMKNVLHPPLYTFSLRWWREIFGGGDWTAAMYSTAWSIVAILFVFAAVRQQTGLGLTTCVGLAMALSPAQVHLGTEVRGYAMLMGLSAMGVWQMVRIEEGGATFRRVWLLGLTLCPLLLTHYFAIGGCAAVGAWGLLRLRGPMRWHLLASIAVAAAGFVVLWLPQAVSQIKDMEAGDGFLKTGLPFWRHSLPSGFAIPLRLFVSARTRWAIAVSIGLVSVTVAGVWRRPALLPWLLMLVMPIGTLLVLDALRGTQHTWFVRYAAAAAVAIPAAPVLAAASLRPTAGWGLGLGFVALTAAGLGVSRDVGSPTFHHMTDAFLPVIARERPDTPLVAFSPPGRPHDYYANSMLVEWSHVAGFFPRPTMRLVEPTPADVQRLRDAAHGGRVWLVTSGEIADGANMPPWLHSLLPTARLLQPPLAIPAGGEPITPQPPVELWLLELGPPAAEQP